MQHPPQQAPLSVPALSLLPRPSATAPPPPPPAHLFNQVDPSGTAAGEHGQGAWRRVVLRRRALLVMLPLLLLLLLLPVALGRLPPRPRCRQTLQQLGACSRQPAGAEIQEERRRQSKS